MKRRKMTSASSGKFIVIFVKILATNDTKNCTLRIAMSDVLIKLIQISLYESIIQKCLHNGNIYSIELQSAT